MSVNKAAVAEGNRELVLQGDGVRRGSHASGVCEGGWLPANCPSTTMWGLLPCSLALTYWLPPWRQWALMTGEGASGILKHLPSGRNGFWNHLIRPHSLFFSEEQKPRMLKGLPKIMWPKKPTDGHFHLVGISGYYVSGTVPRAWHVLPQLILIQSPLWCDYKCCPNKLGQDYTPRSSVRCNKWLFSTTEVYGSWVCQIQPASHFCTAHELRAKCIILIAVLTHL